MFIRPVWLLIIALPIALAGAGRGTQQDRTTYSKDVEPIVRKHCLPCHLADSENPSGLALDTYTTLRRGGENGDPVVPEEPEESILYLKLLVEPPFGRQMPRNRKRLSDEEIATIRTWIEAGARP